MHIVGVSAGEELILPLRKLPRGTEVVVRPFSTSHAGCPSLGYAIGTRRKQQVLKSEYQGLASTKLRDLARDKVQLKEEVVEEDFDIAYTGDTTLDGLVESSKAWSSYHTLFCEATFLDDKTRDMAADRGHMHVDDILNLLNVSKNRKVVLMHISDRYTAPQALAVLSERIPEHEYARIDVAVSSLQQFHPFRDLSKSGLVPLAAYVKRIKSKGPTKANDSKPTRQPSYGKRHYARPGT